MKIEPGKDARFWEDCSREGYICVGWDEVGDLSQYESKESFHTRFEEAYPYKGALQAKRKGNKLWTLTELEPGDLRRSQSRYRPSACPGRGRRTGISMGLMSVPSTGTRWRLNGI